MSSIIDAIKVVVESYIKNCEAHRELVEIECNMRSNSHKL